MSWKVKGGCLYLKNFEVRKEHKEDARNAEDFHFVFSAVLCVP
jgi:hypothetical protein